MSAPHSILLTLVAATVCLHPPALLGDSLPAPVVISTDWKLQDAAKVSLNGGEVSQASFQPPATVPGTVLTTLVNNKVYPEPLYGENNRPDKIPESLCRTPYWYRTTFSVPTSFSGRTVWLNFDGINYSAEVWVNGQTVGSIKGAFTRGIFDISKIVKPGDIATLAVKVNPQPNPGDPKEHTVRGGLGKNGGITAIDGPTFLCSIGWDWIPSIRDRNTGIWSKVFLSATGPVVIKDPFVSADVPLPKLDSADLKVEVTLKNIQETAQKGVLKGVIGEGKDAVSFQQSVEVPANSTTLVTLDPATKPELHLKNPKLWWPNGYGAQNLYPVHLSFDVGDVTSDVASFNIGIRKITTTVPGTENLTLSVNGVPVVCKGGNWGLDEALKRIPRERLEAQIRMHQQANYNMIRNWVGQSTSEDLYDLCDKYGIMLWDEFFQPNPGDGPNPTDLETYLANSREKIVRFRNHPSIAVRCGRNEGRPPENINDSLQKLITELVPGTHYQPSSTDGHGVHSGGPYRWRTPQAYYGIDAAFKTEIGSVSIPTIESVQSMMPKKDWETINDDWVEHDLGKGASAGELYPGELNLRYGTALNLADFVRKGQLMNYEAFRSMYEGRLAKMFNPTTGIITWMSQSAQPSFVWQLYSWDLEPNSALYAASKACEPVHIMLNESRSNKAGSSSGHVQVINNQAIPLSGATASVAVYNLDGTVAYQHDQKVEAPATAVTDLGAIAWPDALSKVHFVKLKLLDQAGKLISENFYWRGIPGQEDNLQDLQNLPVVKLEASVKRHDADGKTLLDVTLTNPAPNIALMAHLQLRRKGDGQRVLPVFYSDNYVSLLPKESKTIVVEAATTDLKGDKPLIVVDGWNVDLSSVSTADCDVALNTNAQVSSWPVTRIAVKWFDAPLDQIKITCCGAGKEKDFLADVGYDAGNKTQLKKDEKSDVDINGAPTSFPALYRNSRTGEFTYTFPMKESPKGYLVRLYFAELGNEWGKDSAKGIAGKRLFNVEINDKPVLKEFDIFAAAGGLNKAVVKEFDGIVPDKEGNVRINFWPGSAGTPKVNGIEVVPNHETGKL
ncbi:MAG: glycoside hydrolase family 2 [Proteobacteria bacterium]|nr:glycoside hydrolase family 2 [Pseudomonadota bacterium]